MSPEVAIKGVVAQMSDKRPHDGHYFCVACGRWCKSDWSEEEARAEAARKFPGMEIGGPDCALVCDDCYIYRRPMQR